MRGHGFHAGQRCRLRTGAQALSARAGQVWPPGITGPDGAISHDGVRGGAQQYATRRGTLAGGQLRHAGRRDPVR